MKAKITKEIWVKAGIKAGWFKTAQSKVPLRVSRTRPTDPFGEMGGPIPPKKGKEYSVHFPNMGGPVPLITGMGPTPQDAVNDLKAQTLNDAVGKAWVDSIDWDNWTSD